MALSQSLQQKLLQRLSPQQIQLMKLLQVPTANLDERIKEEIEENPALELESDDEKDNDHTDEFADLNDYENEETENEYDSIDVSDYLQDDDIADYKTREEQHGEDNEAHEVPVRTESSLYDILISQLGLLNLDEEKLKIANQIIGSIDEDGYLRRETNAIVDDLAFRQNIETTPAEVESLIEKIQQFDPPGIGARNLPECLLIQLRRLEKEGKNTRNAIIILQKYFEEFTKKHYEKIQKVLNLSNDELKQVIGQIVRLNPKPGGNIGNINRAETYIIPDFFIYNNNGRLELTLNSKNAPELRISDDYRNMMREYDQGSKKNKQQKEAVLFIKQKIDSAKWFIDAIKQRQHTLMDTMTAIMNIQYKFFLTGDETNLKPMILKDVAEKTKLDISTVSRVANSKFVQTEFGTYRLKFFFSESLSTDSGEEVSTREVKKILTDLIENEGKRQPLSDEKLTELLQEKGYNIARRTVAKYREQLNIPVARLRKELI